MIQTVTFGARLRALLTSAGVTPYRLARLTGLTEGALSRLLSDQRAPSLHTSRRIARALGISLDALCEGVHLDQ